MKSEVKFEDWMKFDLRVGEILEVNEDSIKVNLGDKILVSNNKINVHQGEKIIVGLREDKLIIPLVGNSNLVSDKDIELGSRVR